jgi:outer membrane protein assembly factor BamB
MRTDDALDQFDRDLDQLTWGGGGASSADGEVAGLLAAAGAVHALDAADVHPDPNPGFLRHLEEMLAMKAPAQSPTVPLAFAPVYHMPEAPALRPIRRGGKFAFLEFIAAALLIFVLAAAAYGGGAFDRFLPAVATPIPAPTTGMTGMYRGDAGRTGVMPGFGPTGAPILAWKTPVLGAIHNPPVVAGDSIFFIEQDPTTKLGFVTRLDAKTGAKVWSWQVGAVDSSSPAVADRLVIALTGTGLVALNIDSGAVVWRYDSGGTVIGGSPAVANGLVYFSTNELLLQAVNATTGEGVWSAALPYGAAGDASAVVSSNPHRGSPAVGDGIVVAQGGNGYVMAADATTGRELWRLRSNRFEIFSGSSTISAGVVYLGGMFPLSPQPEGSSGLGVALRGRVTAVAAKTGAILWQRDDLVSPSSLAISGGALYIADGSIVAVNAATGGAMWEFQQSGSMSDPIVAGGIVYARGGNGRLYGLDAASGKRVWEAYVGVSGEPTVADGKVIVIGGISVYAIGGDDSATAPDSGDPKVDVSGLAPCVPWRTNDPSNLRGTPSATLDITSQAPTAPTEIFNQVLVSNLPKGPAANASQLAGIQETLRHIADCAARPETVMQYGGFYTDDYFRRILGLGQSARDIASRGFYGA